MLSNNLNELYTYLTIKNNVDNLETLEKFLLKTGHKNLIANVVEILHECDLSKINLEPILKICLKGSELSDDEFVILYSMLATKALKHLTYAGILMINRYIKERPSIIKNNLLILPIGYKGENDVDLSYVEPKGHVSYLIDLIDIDKINKKRENVNINADELFLKYAKSKDDFYIEILLYILKQYPQVSIAGGFPLMILSGETVDNRTDLDIFIYGEKREETMKKIITDIENCIGVYFPIYHQIKNSVINLWFEGTWIRPQIIMSPADNLFELLFNFDLSYSGVAYTPYNKRFECTLDALYAIKTRSTFINVDSIKPNRLLKAYYKNYRVIKYQPFVLAENHDGLEIFMEDGLNLENLEKVMPKDKFLYDYMFPNTEYPVNKNLFDLRAYYKDENISNLSIDVNKFKYEGISMDNYAHQSAVSDSYRFVCKINELSEDVIFKLVLKIKDTSICVWTLNTDYRKQTPPVKIHRICREFGRNNEIQKMNYLDVEISEKSVLSTEINMIINKANNTFGKFQNDIQKNIDNKICYRFKLDKEFKIYDINHKEIDNCEVDDRIIMNIKDVKVITDESFMKNKREAILSIILSSIQLFD